VFAPAGTPAAIINRLNQEIVRCLDRADVKEKFMNLGMETVGSFAGAVCSQDEIGNGKMGQADQGCRHPRRITAE